MSDLRQQLQSTLGNAYTIERELGGGGMSRVFLATEQSLGRLVVVKVLPSETAGAVSVERFRREIRLAASLQQANIVPVLSSATREASLTTRCPSSAERKLRFVAPRLGLRPPVVSQRAARALPDE